MVNLFVVLFIAFSVNKKYKHKHNKKPKIYLPDNVFLQVWLSVVEQMKHETNQEHG